MALIVHKYGGTSVGSPERIKNVAKRVAKARAEGHDIVVVVSAMSGETNRLVALAHEMQEHPDPRELDVVLATGEQVTIGLLAMALKDIGVDAKSYTGWQVALQTDTSHTKARIENIDDEKMRADLAAGKVVIVAGFQGISSEGNISTLGRGGSDTSAVAIAAALKADECQIYTDVDGVYTTDPRVVPEARRMDTVTFEEMIELASLGSKVLQIRSVEFAGKYKVRLRVLSSLQDGGNGTLITFEEDDNMERAAVTGIAFDKNQARINVRGVPDKPGVAYQILGAVADANIEVDMIIQKCRQRRHNRLLLHRSTRRLQTNHRTAATTSRQHRRRLHRRRRHRMQSLRSRLGHAFTRRRSRQNLPYPRRRRHQHPNDFNFRNQSIRPD